MILEPSYYRPQYKLDKRLIVAALSMLVMTIIFASLTFGIMLYLGIDKPLYLFAISLVAPLLVTLLSLKKLPPMAIALSAVLAGLLLLAGVACLLIICHWIALYVDSSMFCVYTIENIASGEFLTAILACWFALILFIKIGQRGYHCDQCRQWCTEEGALLAFYTRQTIDFAIALTRGDLSFLDDAEPILTEPFQDYFLVSASRCEACNDFFVVTVYRVQKMSNLDKGKKRRLVDGILLSRAAFQHLLFEKSRFPPPVSY
jgi:hypothetical protein